MKKLAAIIIVSALILALFGCGKAPLGQQTTAESEPTTEETTSNVVRVTFREGLTLVQIAEKLEENDVCSAADFVDAAQDADSLKERFPFLDGIDEENTGFLLEGYLFPDTYDFYRGEQPSSVVGRFLKNFEAKFDSEMESKAASLDMSVNDAVILASIIQAECGYENEMGNVSSVFHNRIVSPGYGKLQSDVTANYVSKVLGVSEYLDGDGERFAELYNTYKCTGLPAGPICCPGLAALKAAVEPNDTPYFFFVTDSDMKFYYAETYEKHLENCTECGIY